MRPASAGARSGAAASRRALDLDAAQVGALAGHAAALVADAQRGTADPRPEGTCPDRRWLAAPPARGPRPAEDLLDGFVRAARACVEDRSPAFLAYFPTMGLATSAVAEMLAAAYNRFTGSPDLAAPLVCLEHMLMRWFCDLFGLPATAIGTMSSGTSMSTLTAVAAARDRLLGAGADLRRARAYATEHTHHSVAKALRTAGLPEAAFRVVPATAGRRMDVSAAARAVAADRRAGHDPFLLVGTAGITADGTIDPLRDLAALAARERLWFHVDAAYGGGFQLTDRGRARMAGIERADSIAVDPPKSLFLPFGTGLLLCRSPRALHDAFARRGSYLDDMDDMDDEALPSYSDLGPELSRAYRALRVWLPLHLHGTDAFRDALDDMLDLAEYAHRRLSADPLLETGPPPDLTTVAFRLRHGEDDANVELLHRVNATGGAYLSSAVLDRRRTLRMTMLNPRLYREDLDTALAAVHRAARSCSRPGNRRG
ncbi:aspartate aminotransferase family protein [Streptomyces capparidis]